jgi:heme-degrading monooxygenase HmoA
MIAVIFEVCPKEECVQEYLDIAAELSLELESIDGLISIERFSSLSNTNKKLSLSYWRDEASLKVWRNMSAIDWLKKQVVKAYLTVIEYELRMWSVIMDCQIVSSHRVIVKYDMTMSSSCD